VSETIDTDRIDPKNLSTYIAMPHGNYLPWPTVLSLIATIRACDKVGVSVQLGTVAGSSLVTLARDRLYEGYLSMPEYSRLFWIDSDIVWTPEDFFRMLQLSYHYPVVCAGYTLRDDSRPNTYVVQHPDMKNFELNGAGCVKIHGTGLGFTVLQREAVLALAETKPTFGDQMRDDRLHDVFRIDTHDGNIRGEDAAFFADLRALGYPIWLDPRIDLGHCGLKIFRGNMVAALGLTHVYEQLDKERQHDQG